MTQQYFWLNANPYEWSFHKTVVGKPEEFTIYNGKGNKRFSFKCFKDAKVGDIVIGYQSHTSKQILAIYKVSREIVDASDPNEYILLTKYIDLPRGISREELKDDGLTNIMPLRNVKGSLFPLEEKDYLAILKLIEEKNPTLLKGNLFDDSFSLADKIEQLDVSTAIQYAKDNGSYYLGWSIPIGMTFTKEEVETELQLKNIEAGITVSEKDDSIFIINTAETQSHWTDENHFTFGDDIETNNLLEGEPTLEYYGLEEYVHMLDKVDDNTYRYKGIAKLEVEEKLLAEPEKEGDPYIYAVDIFGTMVNALEDEPIEDNKEVETIESEDRSENSNFTRDITTKVYNRSSEVSEYAKNRANGICQLCGKPAPFLDKQGKPYLESHHVIWLSRGGEDSIHNVVGLCPNCHSKMHVVDDPEDVAKLLKKCL